MRRHTQADAALQGGRVVGKPAISAALTGRVRGAWPVLGVPLSNCQFRAFDLRRQAKLA